jgi:ABC-type glycerol-3-phosphate transport system substrate-binding protein
VVDGEILAFTWDWNNVVAHINLDMLEAVGLPFPNSDWDEETFLEYARKLTRTAGGRQVFGTVIRPNYFTTTGVLYNFGAQFLTDDMTASALDRPEALEAFQFLYDLVYKYEVSPRPDPGSNYISQFLADQVAIAMGTGRSPIRRWIEGKKNFNIQYVPSCRINQVVFGSGGWPVVSMTKHPEEAFFLSSFLAGVYSQTYLLEASGIPTRISVMDAILPDAPPENSMLYRHSADIARVVQAPLEYNEIERIFNSYFSQMMANEISVEDAVSGMHNEINEVLSSH